MEIRRTFRRYAAGAILSIARGLLRLADRMFRMRMIDVSGVEFVVRISGKLRGGLYGVLISPDRSSN